VNILTGGIYSFPVNTITVGAGTTIEVCKGNPKRVALGFYSLSPDLTIYPTYVGAVLSQIRPWTQNTSGIWYLAEDLGPLVQIEWYAYSTAIAYITVLQVVKEN